MSEYEAPQSPGPDQTYATLDDLLVPVVRLDRVEVRLSVLDTGLEDLARRVARLEDGHE